MAIQLSEEQFSQLISNVTNKKKTKSIVKDFNNAPNLNEWLDNSFEFLSVAKLMQVDLPDFYVNTILHNLDLCGKNMSPIICADANKRHFYYKYDDKWLKDKKFIEIIKKKVFQDAIIQIQNKYIKPIIDDSIDYNDELKSEKQFESSKNYEKLQIVSKLCDVDKYPTIKLYEKILIKLGKKMKEENIDSD